MPLYGVIVVARCSYAHWINRNKCYHDHIFATPFKLYNDAVQMPLEYVSANLPSQQPTSSFGFSLAASSYGVLKLNVDVSFCSSSKVGKLAFVLRDTQAFVLLCGVTAPSNLPYVFAAELVAV